MILYKEDKISNIASTGNSCFWLADIKHFFTAEAAVTNEAKFERDYLWHGHVLYNVFLFNHINKKNEFAPMPRNSN